MTRATALIGPEDQSISVELPPGWERVEVPQIPLAAREAQPPAGGFATNLTVHRLDRPGVDEATLAEELAEVITTRQRAAVGAPVQQPIKGRNWLRLDVSYVDPVAGTIGQRHLFLGDIQLVISFAGSRVSELADVLRTIVDGICMDPGQPRTES